MQQPVEVQVDEHEQIVKRVAAIDVAKASGMVCLRVPHERIPDRRVTTVWPVAATTATLPPVWSWWKWVRMTAARSRAGSSPRAERRGPTSSPVATRIETWNSEPMLEVEAHDRFANAPDLLGRDMKIAQL